MEQTKIRLAGYPIKVVSLHTVVVGTGAAGYNAADCLYQNGQTDIAIVTEHVNAGTSRNTGSDKQTYYKLSLAGAAPDSIASLAAVFFKGQCVDGDIALCEASLSAQSFYKLVGLGVPFPKNAYGEYVGYKTDHDPSERATSVGPYTSRMMTECLQKAVAAKNIPVFDAHQVVQILTDEKQQTCVGLLCLDTKENAYTLFSCQNVIYATGGPAGIYADSVYPYGQYGSSGIAFAAGVTGKNLTEWQYGMASVKPRWNVSGTYMQVLPKFVSTEQDGTNPREFLFDFFVANREGNDIASGEGALLSNVFLKGYQWPFDVRKIKGGSSIIDVLVYIESCIHGRRIFLDYRANPQDKALDFDLLAPEAKEYLEKVGACFGTPIERLKKMNQPAVDFYKEKGVDLETEPLEIALCAQHNNGGLSIDKWWQTNVQGLFAVGEVSGSHGVYRPGGSALNAGQVGAVRAAEYIAAKSTGNVRSIEETLAQTQLQVLQAINRGALPIEQADLKQQWETATKRMSRVAAAMRNDAQITQAIQSVKHALSIFEQDPVQPVSPEQQTEQRTVPNTAWRVHRLYDMLLAQYVYLNAMADYIQKSGQSRGSALYTVPQGQLPYPELPELFRFVLDDERYADQVQEVTLSGDVCHCHWRAVRTIPQREDSFETVWRNYRENKNIS